MTNGFKIEEGIVRKEGWEIAPEVLGEILETARRSPTAGNSQHWRFSWDGRNLHILLDVERAASFLNFRFLDAWLALGCLLEDIDVRAAGLGVDFEVLADSRLPGARLIPRPSICRAHPLAGALGRRCTNRGAYKSAPISAVLARVVSDAALDIGVRAHLLEERNAIKAASGVLAIFERFMVSHPGVHRSLFRWLRWNKTEAADGLTVTSLMLPFMARRGIHWLRFRPLCKLLSAIGIGKISSETMARHYVKTGAIGFLQVDSLDAASLVRAGRAFERLWLAATQRGLALQPMTGFTQLDFRRRHGAGEGLSAEQSVLLGKGAEALARWIPEYDRRTPILAFRLGTALRPPVRSPRRPLPEWMEGSVKDSPTAIALPERKSFWQRILSRLPEKLAVTLVLLWEALGRRPLPRVPEPDLVMDDPADVEAYTEAGGRIDGVMAASYLFNSARVSQTIEGCATVLDIGCGPATQLAQIAELNPGIQFVGIDLSLEMLDKAEKYVAQRGLRNVRFLQDDASRLEKIDTASVDGVISTMALHHLPTRDGLEACFRHIRRVLRPGGALYLVDFGRLTREGSIQFCSRMNADRQPEIFTRDYENSLRAAFSLEDFRGLAEAHLPWSRVVSTFLAPLLTIVKTPDRPVGRAFREVLRSRRAVLPRRYRNTLDDLRLLTRLGGLGNDPFSI